MGIKDAPPISLDTIYQPRWKTARQRSTWLTTFQSGHGWTVSGGTGSTANDTAVFDQGTQSVKVVTDGAGGNATVSKGITTDLTARSLVVLARVEDITHHKTFQVFAGDASFTNSYRWDVQTAVPSDPVNRPVYWASGEWVLLVLNPATASVVGSPTRASITTFRIQVADDNTGNPVTVRLNGFGYRPETTATWPNGVCIFSFDDCYASHMTLAKAHLDANGHVATLFPVLDNLDQAGYYTTAQMLAAAERDGWEIASHASNGTAHGTTMTGFTQAQRKAEFRTLKKYLRDRGHFSETYAWPQGNFNAAAVADARNYFAGAASVLSGLDPWPLGDVMRMRRNNLANSASTAANRTLMDNAKAMHGVVHFFGHEEVSSGATGQQFNKGFLDDASDYAVTIGMPVRTVGEVLATLPAAATWL